MDRAEFDRWLTAHNAAFPGYKPWIEEKDGICGLVECLDDITFEDAREATRTLNKADAMDPPPFGEHGRLVRRMARQAVFERRISQDAVLSASDREPRYRCWSCLDSGIVTVANIYVGRGDKRPIQNWLDGTVSEIPVCGVFCTCERGRGRRPQFDSERMFHVHLGYTTAENSQALREWLASEKHWNRVSLFDQFNALPQ